MAVTSQSVLNQFKVFQLKDQLYSYVNMLTNDNVANAFKIHLISF